jgi:hypothetical protein
MGDDRLTSLLDEVQPDYLKWDNNMCIDVPQSPVSAAHILFVTVKEN